MGRRVRLEVEFGDRMRDFWFTRQRLTPGYGIPPAPRSGGGLRAGGCAYALARSREGQKRVAPERAEC